MKVCTKCETEKGLTEFSKHKMGKLGLKAACKACISIDNAKYMEANRESINQKSRDYYHKDIDKQRARSKKYREEHPDKVKESCRNYYTNNKDKMLLANKKWADNNKDKRAVSDKKYQEKYPEKVAERKSTWQKNNPGKVNAANNKRRSLKLKATPTWSDLEAIKQFYINTPPNMEVDHIIPLNHPDVQGLHVLANLQYLSKYDNRSKTNKFDGTYENIGWQSGT